MFLDDFCTITDDRVRIAARDASRFAKEVAGDFNPIHDPGSRRFCVPGDLLFALVVCRYGLSRHMAFRFRGMVGEGVTLCLPPTPGERFSLTDEQDRVCLEVERDGPTTCDMTVIEPFVRSYVAFSGRNFPHILQPLLAGHGVMFNPDRPLVMYDSMAFTLEDFVDGDPVAELADARLDVAAKRADALLDFAILVGGANVGHGSKKLVISGLKPYDDERMKRIMADYEARRAEYLASAQAGPAADTGSVAAPPATGEHRGRQ